MHLGKTVCLNMIVKNESHVIEKTFDNLSKYITFDYWVISDTGSTDGTQEIIKNYFAKKGIPGELVHHEWQDFGYNRTMSLRAGYNKTDYIFIFDADDSIHGDFKLPQKWDVDSYLLKFGDTMTYYRPQLVNNRKKWKYEGVLHEYIVCEETAIGQTYHDGNYYVDSGKTGDRSRDPQKYHKDAQILKAAYYADKEKNGGLSNRYAFYCAQSFKDSNQIDDAIEWYTLVADTLPNWVQERYYSCVMLGQLYERKGNFEKSIYYHLRASTFDSERIEGVVFACDYLRRVGMHELVMLLYNKYKNYNPDPKNKLFLFREPYDGSLECNASMSACFMNQKDIGYECIRKLISSPTTPQNIRNIIFDNLRFYVHELDKDSESIDIFYALTNFITTTNNQALVVVWNLLFKKHRAELIKPSRPIKIKSKTVEVFLSFTSCKRFDLFEQTVNSIMNHFTDKEKIDYWFCVDDNSSHEDRTKMKKKYPWIVFYNKTEKEKGHRPSMNIIWNKLNEMKPKYWIHIEDDFLFHSKKNYITDAIKFLETSGNIKQVLFNRNYAETIDDIKLAGHSKLSPGFVVHDHKMDTVSYPNCHYWPHYSFRPGVVVVEAVLGLGNFDSPNTFFEMDYANRWVHAGYKTAFFDGINCRHIGRLTSERHNTDAKNAYSLNNEDQFSNKPASMKIVNLKRRPDRMEATKKIMDGAGITDYEFVDAIDGKELRPSLELKKLFAGNDFGSRIGVLGCALTHYKLWRTLCVDTTHEYYTIFEDDITLVPGFKQKYDSIKSELHKFDCVMLGYHMFSAKREETKNMYVNQTDKLSISPNKKQLNIGGTFGYSINKKGAKALINYIEKNGIRHGIDYVMKICPDLNTWEVRPQIVFSEWYETPGQNVDSDIQTNYETLNFDMVPDPSTEFNFLPGLDQISNDCYYHQGKSLAEMMEIALADPKCAGFNTLGFFKTSISTLNRSPYFGPMDGLYVKKVAPQNDKPKNAGTTRVKMLCDWQSSEKLVEEWSIMPVPSSVELTAEDKDVDVYVIINKPANGYFESEKSVLYQMEPTVYDLSKNWGAKLWPKQDKEKYMRVQNHTYLNGVQWNFKVLNIPEKKNDVVSILSGNNWDTGHILRTSFVKNNTDLIKVYGKVNFHSLPSYMGPVPDENRFNVYSGVKYCIACENNAEVNYATEKIWEPIISEVLAFYWGCPNLDDYIDSRAFVRLPIEDPIKARALIDQAIAEDWWSQRIDVIREEKRKVLNIYGFMPNLQRVITRTKAVIITLKEATDRYDMIEKIKKNLAKLGIDTEVFYGVNGKNIVNNDNKLSYNGETYTYDPSVRLNGQPMTVGELGCAWSHMSVYKKLRDDPKYNSYLVLEDDAEMCGDLFALNDAIMNLPKVYDVCHIGETIWHPFVHTDPVNSTYFNIHKQFFNGTMSCFISKSGANKLISDSLNLPADDLLSNSFLSGKISVYAPKNKIYRQTKNVVSTIKTVDAE